MASFAFSFAGDDIEGGDNDAGHEGPSGPSGPSGPAGAQTPASSAFPVQGKPQLPPQRHALDEMLARLPSKIAYSLLDVRLDAGGGDPGAAAAAAAPREAPGRLRLPRRELWDVKLQLMAEEDEEAEGEGEGDALASGLGTHDVRTGIYEGGFKSWESSVDLVKVLLQQPPTASGAPSAPRPSEVARCLQDGPAHVIELGCGTALPSLALFHWAACAAGPARQGRPLAITVADYNPSVLYLVTLPNFVLAWALQQRHACPALQTALSIEGDDYDGDGDGDGNGNGNGNGNGETHGELELTDDVKAAFCAFLATAGITLSFLSGGWSPAFLELLLLHARGDGGDKSAPFTPPADCTLVLGAETIYSPFALEAFSETVLAILRRERAGDPASASASASTSTSTATATAIVAAKKLYFGVGGSLDDFVQRMRGAGATVTTLREEADGVRRGVVRCQL